MKIALSLLGTLLLAGCIIDTTTHSERSGRLVGPATLEALQPGRDKEFVLGLLGEPSTRSTAGEKTEVWKWEYRSREHHSSSLIFVIDANKTSEVRTTTYVLFEDGKVAKVWQD